MEIDILEHNRGPPPMKLASRWPSLKKVWAGTLETCKKWRKEISRGTLIGKKGNFVSCKDEFHKNSLHMLVLPSIFIVSYNKVAAQILKAQKQHTID